MARVPYNKLLTNLASSSRTGKYWPSVVFVRTSLRSVRTATTSGQYSPVRPSRSVSKRLISIQQEYTVHRQLENRFQYTVNRKRNTLSLSRKLFLITFQNSPFPSSHVSLFQNDSSCKTLICMKMHSREKRFHVNGNSTQQTRGKLLALQSNNAFIEITQFPASALTNGLFPGVGFLFSLSVKEPL